MDELLRVYYNEVCILRAAHHGRSLSALLGAGVSYDLKLPTWDALVNLIAEDVDPTSSVDNIRLGPIARAELLYRHFVNQTITARGVELDERELRGLWSERIRTLLYRDLPGGTKLEALHPYLGEFLDIFLKNPVCVNYNFDSCIQMMLRERQAAGSKDIEFSTTFDEPTATKLGVFYHPNGFLPKNSLEGISDGLVFCESDFGNQLAETIAGRYVGVSHILATQVCLLLGLSLADESLRHLLHRNARLNPGQVHFAVEWHRKGSPPSEELKNSLWPARFDLYNLVTLFLDNDGICALGKAIKMSDAEFELAAKAAGIDQTRRIYYLTGVPGAGKTSMCRYISGVRSYPEWMGDPPELLARPHTELNDSERTFVDKWVADQFKEKNDKLLNEGPGLLLIDRGPLDPVAFESDPAVIQKATRYQKLLAAPLAPGAVVFLDVDPAEAGQRVARRQGRPKPETYQRELQARTRRVYGDLGVQVMNTRSMSLEEQIHELIRLIFRKPYEESDLTSRLNTLCQHGLT
jgi:thymidylate kinase